MKALLFSLVAFAADDAIVPPLPEPGFLENALRAVTGVVGGIPTEGGIVVGLALVVEIVLRVWKSEKPRSLLFAAARGLELLAQLFVVIGDGCRKLSVLLNKVIPQRTNQEKLEGPK